MLVEASLSLLLHDVIQLLSLFDGGLHGAVQLGHEACLSFENFFAAGFRRVQLQLGDVLPHFGFGLPPFRLVPQLFGDALVGQGRGAGPPVMSASAIVCTAANQEGV
jgi:hypothetical protein